MPPNAPYSQLGPEKMYDAGFIKKFQNENVFFRMDETSLRDTSGPKSRHLARLAMKIGEVRFTTKIQTENLLFGKSNSGGLLRQN